MNGLAEPEIYKKAVLTASHAKPFTSFKGKDVSTLGHVINNFK